MSQKITTQQLQNFSQVGKNGSMKPKGKLIPIFKRLLHYVFIYKKSLSLIIVGFVGS